MRKKFSLALLFLALAAIFAGCAHIWSHSSPTPESAQYGWQQEYSLVIGGWLVFISTGLSQVDSLEMLEIFVSPQFSLGSRDKLFGKFKGETVVYLYFSSKSEGRMLPLFNRKDLRKQWQSSYLNGLDRNKCLAKLPPEVKEKVQRLLAYASRQY